MIDTKIIINILIALFIYNGVLSIIGKAVLSIVLNSDNKEVVKKRKEFKDRLKEKLEDQ